MRGVGHAFGALRYRWSGGGCAQRLWGPRSGVDAHGPRIHSQSGKDRPAKWVATKEVLITHEGIAHAHFLWWIMQSHHWADRPAGVRYGIALAQNHDP
jgi:hypothetical protein